MRKHFTFSAFLAGSQKRGSTDGALPGRRVMAKLGASSARFRCRCEGFGDEVHRRRRLVRRSARTLSLHGGKDVKTAMGNYRADR